MFLIGKSANYLPTSSVNAVKERTTNEKSQKDSYAYFIQITSVDSKYKKNLHLLAFDIDRT